MPTITWPSTLPIPLSDGYSETPPNNVVTWKADSGPTHTRLRGSAASSFLSLKFRFTDTDFTTFDTFLITTSKYGSLSFNFTHPRLHTTVTANFVFPNPVDYSNYQNTGIVTVKLEISA
jgi:hypothetical protein